MGILSEQWKKPSCLGQKKGMTSYTVQKGVFLWETNPIILYCIPLWLNKTTNQYIWQLCNGKNVISVPGTPPPCFFLRLGVMWHVEPSRDPSVASASGWVREASELPWIEASSAPWSSKPRDWRHAAHLGENRLGGRIFRVVPWTMVITYPLNDLYEIFRPTYILAQEFYGECRS